MTTTTARGPYAKTKQQRETIIHAALDYFGQYGYHGASMREIARHVGLSQAGLLHHFKTKAELLTATLESRDALTGTAIEAAVARSRSPLAGIVAIVEDNVTHRNLVQMFTVVSAEATDESHPAHQYFVDRSRRVIDHMRTELAAAVEQGAARADLDVDLAARQCQAMIYGLQVQWLLDPRTDMVALFRAFLDDLTRP